MANYNVEKGGIAKLPCSLEFQNALQDEKPDVKDMFPQFFSSLDAIFDQDTRYNIQTCTEWIITNIAIIRSRNRAICLGKYLVSLSESITLDGDSLQDKAIRNRLDLVLLISDVLHAVRFHHPAEAALAKDLLPYIKELVALVAQCCHEGNSLHERRLKAVIKFWFINNLLDIEDISAVMESARHALGKARGNKVEAPRKRKDTMPKYVGESGTMEYDFPASYMAFGRPRMWRGEPRTQKMPTYPSRKTLELLDAYFEKLDALYKPTGDNPSGATGGYRQWTAAAGHSMTQHKTTKSLKKVSNGLGWSMDACKDMVEDGFIRSVAAMRAQQSGPARMDLDGQMGDDGRHMRRQRLSRSRSRSRPRSGSPRGGRFSSDSDSDRYERRRGRRSVSRSSFDSRDGRSSSRRRNGSTSQRRSRSRRNDRDRDEGRYSDRNYPRHKPPPSAPSCHNRDTGNRNTALEQGYPQPTQVPNTVPPGFPSLPPPPPPQFQGQFPPHFQAQLPGQFQNQQPGQFPGQLQGQPSGHLPNQFPGFPGQFSGPMSSNFSAPPFPPQFPGGPASGQPVPPNFAGFPQYPQMGAPGFQNQQQGGSNGNFGQNAGYGGFNRGGFQGHNLNRGGYGGNNQRGRGGGRNWS